MLSRLLGRRLPEAARAPGPRQVLGRPPRAPRGPLLIAIDTSSFVAYLGGAAGPDVEAVAVALEHAQAALPPVVLTELLSDPKVTMPVKDLFLQLPMLEITEGYWHRAGLLRARLLARGRRARLADSLIAQSCLDHDLSLVTRDSDFRHFVRLAGIRLVPAR